jgi:outer membrane protein OmpA-like peptidoglycan-associated protein
MERIVLLIILSGLSGVSFAQNNKAAVKDTIKKAIIQIHLTNHNHEALKQEEVTISSASPKKFYSLITDNEGRASAKVDVGIDYVIQLKTIEDSTTYGNLNIPPLAANQVYNSPFAVDMMYDPGKEYTFHHLEFDFGKATVKKESYKELDDLVEYLERKIEINVEIDGHTDNVGNEEDNKKLSQQRADAVKNYLVRKGIAATRIKTQGFGSTKPIADNATEQGRQKNRRTELVIL